MKTKLKTLIATTIVAGLAGCATQPEELSATYVSPVKYQKYDCQQLEMEMGHISERTDSLYHQLKKKADDDAAQMGIGLLIFWPALFFLEGGDGPEATEYANMRGEFEALRSTSVEKKCTFEMPKSPEKIIQEYAAAEKQRRATEDKPGGIH